MSVARVRIRPGGPFVWRVRWIDIHGRRRSRRYAREHDARMFDTVLRFVARGLIAVSARQR